MRIEQGVSIFKDKDVKINSVDIGEYFLTEYKYCDFALEKIAYLLWLRTEKVRKLVSDIEEKNMAIKIAKLLNQDNGEKND